MKTSKLNFKSEPNRFTHYVTTLTKEREVNIRAQAWVENMVAQGKNYKKISIDQINLLKPNDILYIHGQVLSPASQFKGQSEQSLQQQPIINNEEIWHTARQLAKFLEKKVKLNKEHKFLEITACYTEKYAQDLCIELAKRGYDDIVIYGYRGQLYLNKGYILAGLIPPISNPMIFKNRFAGVLESDDPSYEGGWHIDYELLKDNSASLAFQGILHKKSYYSRNYPHSEI